MEINKTNYESWFLDYYDGNLTAEKTAELFLFLQQNEKLRQEFESFNLVNLVKERSPQFDFKEGLKRDIITVHNINYYLVKEVEGELNLLEKTRLREFLNVHPEFQKERDLFQKTKLQPSREIFQAKKDLKKKVIARTFVQWNAWMAATAIIVLILGIIYINRPQDSEQTAERNPAPVNNEIKSSGNHKTYEVNKNQTELAHEVTPQNKKESPEVKHNNTLNTEKLVANKSENTQIKRNKAERVRVPLPSNVLSHDDENLAAVQRIENINIGKADDSFLPEKRTVEPATAMVYLADESNKQQSFDEKVNDLKDAAANRVNTATGEEILYSQQEMKDEYSDRLPFKSRMIKLVAWAVGKVSGDKVQMTTDFDRTGNLAAYEISAGKFRYERGF